MSPVMVDGVVPFGILQVLRLGLVQACLGAVVVLTTSTLNRIMVVELALPALVPGLLVGWHYVVQLVRPRMGYGADRGRRCTPWMLGGTVVLAVGGVLAALGTAWMAQDRVAGLALALLAFSLIGVGVSACGTSLLVLMAKRVPDGLRAPAATAVWMMMIFGFAVTAVTVGRLIDPYSPERLVLVSAGLGVVVILVVALSLWRLEGTASAGFDRGLPAKSPGWNAFVVALREVWSEPQARVFTVFVFFSMLAYSTQDLVLEPFAGEVFGMSPGQTTQLSGLQHASVLAGMLWVALAGWGPVRGGLGSVTRWMVWGCLASSLAMVGLAWGSLQGPDWPLRANVAALGFANGTFSIAAIATMMRLSTQGRQGREGTRMGLWGAAQAVAFGLGGVGGTALSDLARWVLGQSQAAYTSVFALEACMFVLSALCALWVIRLGADPLVPRSRSIPELERVQT